MVRKRSSKGPRTRAVKGAFLTQRTYTEPSIFGPVSVTELSVTPEQQARLKRHLQEKARRRTQGDGA